MENKAYFDAKRNMIIVELGAIDTEAKTVSPSGKSKTVGNYSGKLTMGDKVVNLNVNAFVTIPKTERKA